MNHDPSFFGVDKELYKMMFNVAVDPADDDHNAANHPVTVALDPDSLSRAFPEQNVDEIRETAPSWFKTGNRLITKKDYEFFLKANT